MATAKIISGNAQKIFKSATVLMGGAVDGTVVTSSPSLTILGAGTPNVGSRVLAITNYVSKSISGNVIAKLIPGSYLIRRSTTTLGLLSGSAGGKNNPIHYARNIRTPHFVNPQPGSSGGWSYTLGRLIAGAPASGSNASLSSSYVPAPRIANYNGKMRFMEGSNSSKLHYPDRLTG